MHQELTQLAQAQLAALSHPISDGDLLKLSLTLGSPLVLDALDILDRNQVTLLNCPNSSTLTLVSGTTTNYNVHSTLKTAALPLGYCPCPTFTLLAFSPGEQNVKPPVGRAVPLCKHLLAAKLAAHLSAAKDKEATLGFLASWATNFKLQDNTTT